jgi:hypothetical protein
MEGAHLVTNDAMRSAASTPGRAQETALARNPLKGEPVSKIPSGNASRDLLDLIAFVAALTTGILLITLGHLTAGGLSTVCAALVGVYAAWRHFRS